jgi:hypothetical protein
MRWRVGAADLSVLDGTPVNCLVVSWSDNEQQRAAIQPVIEYAKRRGIDVVGEVKNESAKASAPAKAAGLAAVVVATPAGGAQKVPGAVFAMTDAVWPGIPVQRGRNSGAGPTGVPWVDANGWRCRLAKVKAPAKTPWVVATPPAELAVSAAAYEIAIADAAVHGGRWLIDINPFKPELLKSLVGTLAAVDRRSAREQDVVARFGVISDFEGDNEFAAGEMLNLAARRPLPCRIVDRTRLTAESLSGLRGAMWVDSQPPDAVMTSALRDFIGRGGLLIASQSGAGTLTTGLKPAGDFQQRFRVYTNGAGRLAVATEPWSDPWVMASDAHLLLSRKHDVLRAWNAGSCNFHYTAAGTRATVQIINYTGREAAERMSLYVAKKFRTATWSDSTGRRTSLDVRPAGQGIEVNLPPLAIYGAVEFGV